MKTLLIILVIVVGYMVLVGNNQGQQSTTTPAPGNVPGPANQQGQQQDAGTSLVTGILNLMNTIIGGFTNNPSNTASTQHN